MADVIGTKPAQSQKCAATAHTIVGLVYENCRTRVLYYNMDKETWADVEGKKVRINGKMKWTVKFLTSRLIHESLHEEELSCNGTRR